MCNVEHIKIVQWKVPNPKLYITDQNMYSESSQLANIIINIISKLISWHSMANDAITYQLVQNST